MTEKRRQEVKSEIRELANDEKLMLKVTLISSVVGITSCTRIAVCLMWRDIASYHQETKEEILITADTDFALRGI